MMDSSDAATPIQRIFRWDLDKTYLKTEFATIGDLLRTALEKPEEKENVPGAIALIQELRRDDGDGSSHVCFVSGSPTQMRKVLEKKFRLDGIEPDEFVLKPTLRNLLLGRFRAIRGQVGYKLQTLLKQRIQGPQVPEFLFGDDAEMDAFIYSMYADLIAGRLGADTLLEILEEAHVYPQAVLNILDHANAIVPADDVERIFIHLEGHSPPGRFLAFGSRVVPVYNYFQAALVLYDMQTLGAAGIMRIARHMMEFDRYGVGELANSFQDLLRRGHLTNEALQRLGNDLVTLDADEWDPETRRAFLRRITGLSPTSVTTAVRNQPHSVPYLDILRADESLKAAVTDRRKKPFL